MIEQHLIELTEAIKANTANLTTILERTGANQTPAATPAPAAKPAKVKAEAPAPVVAPKVEPVEIEVTPEPEAEPEAEIPVVTYEALADIVRGRLKEGEGFKSQFKALREEFKVGSITELTDENRGTFLDRINAIEAL